MESQKTHEPSKQDLEAMGVSENATTINSIEEMGHVVTNWHFNVLNDLHHKLQMPHDVGIDIPTGAFDADGNEEVIDGNEDHKAGFLAGISYALELMDTFPIKGVPEDEEAES